MSRLISFDISSDFGFFKKPDINKHSLTYNIPPKTSILGILGCILGLKGLKDHYYTSQKLQDVIEITKLLKTDYSKARRIAKKLDLELIEECLSNIEIKDKAQIINSIEKIRDSNENKFLEDKEEISFVLENLKNSISHPAYYLQLKELKIGILPNPNGELSEFPFDKIMNKYNSRNSYFGEDKYENIPISEQILIKPKYRIYVYGEKNNNITKELIRSLKNNTFVYMPYLGKNEFIANITNLRIADDVHEFSGETCEIESIFIPCGSNKKDQEDEGFKRFDISKGNISIKGLPSGYLYYEHYPVGYSENGLQYEIRLIKFSGGQIQFENVDTETGKLIESDNRVIYVF